MSKRIDVDAYTQIFEADDGITDEQLVAFGLSAIAELKRCYEQIDHFVDMLHKLGYYGENISEDKQLEWDDASE